MQSTLFLNYITCVDHAYISSEGKVVGGSYHPVFEVSGEVEEQEQVVVDFSKVKKQIKEIVDAQEDGFDHKLWVIPGYSKVEYTITGDTINLWNDCLNLTMPLNAVKIFDTGCDHPYEFLETVNKNFSVQIEKKLAAMHEGVNICVKAEMTVDSFAQTQHPVMFKYSHGLKNSSSWGCQNQSHGHLSFVEFDFFSPGSKTSASLGMLKQIVSDIDGSIFIFKDNVVAEDSDSITIEYETCRGKFTSNYNKHKLRIHVLDTETTVENLVNWFVKRNRFALVSCGVTRVYMSEGLAKGAAFTL